MRWRFEWLAETLLIPWWLFCEFVEEFVEKRVKGKGV